MNEPTPSFLDRLRPRRGWLSRRQRARDRRERIEREDALKYIHKAESKGRRPTLEGVAGAVGLTLDEAARLLGNMQTAGLLVDSDGTPRLTEVGRDSALHIIRAHRLWERYLAEETGFAEEDWHGRAEAREHELTPAELEALAARLGHPTRDPHGDPIPTSDGVLEPHGGTPLAGLAADQAGRIVHLEDEPAILYAQLVAEGLSPGQIVRNVTTTPERVHFWTNGDEHILAPIVAANIFVTPLPGDEAEAAPSGRPLTALALGESARVVALAPGLRGQERRRLLDLGLLPGTVVTAELRSPGGDPTAYLIRGATIALRAEQARQIRVTDEEREGAGEKGREGERERGRTITSVPFLPFPPSPLPPLPQTGATNDADNQR